MAQNRENLERRSAHEVNRVGTFGAGTMATDASSDDEPVMMVRMGSSPHMIGMGYLNVLSRVMATNERRFLQSFSHGDLEFGNIWLVTVLIDAYLDSCRVVGGFQLVIDNKRTAHVRGVVLDPAYRSGEGIRHILARSPSTLFDLGDIDAADLVVRVLPDGTVNQKAFALFSSLGFQATGCEVIPIQGTRLDRHLYQTAEPDEKSYRVLRMHGDRSSMALSAGNGRAI